MIELSLPIFDDKGQTTKDQIVQVLLEYGSLPLVKIFREIRNKYNLSISYQAIRKSIEQLVERGVLKKIDKTYTIDESWVLQLKSFADEVLNAKHRQITQHFTPKQVKKEFTSFTLNSLFELDNFWGDVLLYLAKECSPENKLSINIGHHAWWMLVNLGRESHIYSKYKKLDIETYFLLLDTHALNKKAASVYEAVGVPTVLTKTKYVDECIGIDSVGDVIVEIKYPKEIVKKIKAYIRKHPKGDYDIQEITQLAHTPCKITFNLYRNKELVEGFNSKYLRILRKTGKLQKPRSKRP